MALVYGRLVCPAARCMVSLRTAPIFARNASSTPDTPAPENLGPRQTELANWEKRVLVWTKRFPTLADVPNTVSITTLTTAKDRFRRKVANYLVILTAVGSLVTVLFAKRARARGESITKRSLEWHEELQPGFNTVRK